MASVWANLVDRVLRPEQPRFASCDEAGRAHSALVRARTDERAHALADCERRIETARANVFASGDGVVGAQMTTLEREWRVLHRRAATDDGALRDLWSQIAPPAWIDHPRYRDSEPALQLRAAVALASDPEGVERAEAAVASLAAALAPWDARAAHWGRRPRWRAAAMPAIEDSVVDIHASVLAMLGQSLAQNDAAPIVFARAFALRRLVLRAARRRKIVTRGRSLARELAHVAFLDLAWGAAEALGARAYDGTPVAAYPNPVAPLMELWSTGYLLCALGEDHTVLGVRISG
jgi:hypothetical protein